MEAAMRRLLLISGMALTLIAAAPARSEGVVQLRCHGTLLETRGTAEQQRSVERLRFALGLEAEAPTASAALEQLLQRLSLVRSALQGLAVKDLQVSSPSSWSRSRQGGRAPAVEAALQVSGEVEPARLQALVLELGRLPGVQLAPVVPQADRRQDAAVRRQLLQAAYREARGRAEELAALVGRARVKVLEVQVEGDSLRPQALRVAAAAAPGRLDPAELPPPKDQLAVMARFCAL